MTLAVLDPDLKIRGGGGRGGVGAQSSRPLDKGRGWSPKKIFFWSKNKGGGSPGSPTALGTILVADFCFLFAAMVSAGNSGQVMQVLPILLQSANLK